MRLSENKIELPRKFEVPSLYKGNGTGNALVWDNLRGWGINLYFLINGGGAVHLHEYPQELRGIDELRVGDPRVFVIPEQIGAHAAAAYSLASGRIGASANTTGGALDYANPAMTDAMMHSVPTVYLGALSASTTRKRSPLQDTTETGFNTVAAMKARYRDGCQVIDRVDGIEKVLYNARDRLMDSKPTLILYDPDVLKQPIPWFEVPWAEKPRQYDHEGLDELLKSFPEDTNGKRVVLFVGEEATRYERMPELTSALARLLKVPTVYTQIGVSAVSHENEFAAGYLMLGHNDFSRKLWNSLTLDDTVVCIGFDPFEYSTNQESVNANAVVVTNYNNPYGSDGGTFKHRVEGNYTHIHGDLELVVEGIVNQLRKKQLIRPHIEIPQDLNDVPYKEPPKGFTNMVQFYQTFAGLLKPNTIYIGDVCMGYKDYQRVTQRPVHGVKVLYFHQASTMGQGIGEALGTRFARPDAHIHLVTGDGCFEYFGATLGRMKNLGLVVWILQNGTHALVSWGLTKIKPHLSSDRKLTDVPEVDYVKMANAQGWDGFDLRPDLKNMEEIMRRANSPETTKSMLVRVKVHPEDDLGQNPRLDTLGRQGQDNL